jgi:hypothetical protein
MPKTTSIATCVLAAALACAGCSNFTVVNVHDPVRVSTELQAGDKIRVRDPSGERHLLRVETAAGDHLTAHDRSGAQVRIDYAENPTVERRVFAPGKTVALVIGMAVVVYGVAYAVATVELASSL